MRHKQIVSIVNLVEHILVPSWALNRFDATSYVHNNEIKYPDQAVRVYVDFKITKPFHNWKSGEHKYGGLVWTTNEIKKDMVSVSSAENILLVNLIFIVIMITMKTILLLQ